MWLQVVVFRSGHVSIVAVVVVFVVIAVGVVGVCCIVVHQVSCGAFVVVYGVIGSPGLW